METSDGLPIVRVGVWLYDATVPVRVRVVSSPVSWDFDVEDCDELPIPCFIVEFEQAGSPGYFPSRVANFPSLAEAVAYAKRVCPNIIWDLCTLHG
jgi:hypothetical protein